MQRVQIIDSHTGGEPTRLVIGGGPDLGSGSVAQQMEVFRERHDAFRSAVVCEPRGSDVLVGALLVPPGEPGCTTGVIFFNNVGFLGMCGHGAIGVIATLAFLGRIQPGTHRLDTPVGAVEASLSTDGRVSIRNVISYRYRKAVSVDVPGIGRVIGDIAWGGNWFFLVREPSFELNPNRVDELRSTTLRIRAALEQQGITGEGGGMIDHVELFGPPRESVNDSRNFVLCPGGAYDRSPCGTGTSAKLACLAADGQLAEGEIWRQESIVGSVFEGSYIVNERGILPTITGQAWVNSQSDLLLDPTDPFCWGMR